jgi:succinate dehydrogenase/fumarate reductase cytochrome b subunit
MNNTLIKTVLAVFFSVTLLLTPATAANAQLQPIPCPPGVLCPGSGTTGSGVASINNFIMTIIGWLVGIAFGVAVLFLIIGGFWYIISGGNEETAEKAKNTIINSIIGIIIIILSYVIISVIVNLITGSRTVSP